MARVRLPTVLRPHAGGAAIIDVPASTFGALREVIGERYPSLAERLYDEEGRLQQFVSVFVDGEDARDLASGAELAERAEVVLLPAISGGEGAPAGPIAHGSAPCIVIRPGTLTARGTGP